MSSAPRTKRDHSLYEKWHPHAQRFKIAAQMVIGICIVLTLLVKLGLHAFTPFTPTQAWIFERFVHNHPLTLVGYALALSAGVELAYMLFTPEPDEALEPLILGLAAATLLSIAGIKGGKPSWESILIILVLSAAIGFLFFIRNKYVPRMLPLASSQERPESPTTAMGESDREEESQVAQGQQPSKMPLGDRFVVYIAVAVVLVIGLIAGGAYTTAFEWDWGWTGFTEPKQRTFWNWLDLLIVPSVLALGGYLFTRSENRRTTRSDEQRAKTDREIAKQQRQSDILHAYLDYISQLMLDKDTPLRESEEAQTVAKAHTFATLNRVNEDRKGTLVKFLYVANLIDKTSPVISLDKANLRGADLRGSNLPGANLAGADLRAANLGKLRAANLGISNRKLNENEHQKKTNLRAASSQSADLREAIFKDAYLINANLEGAVLSLTHEELAQQAASLAGATMPTGEKLPTGEKYEDWLRSQGRREENNDPQ